MSFQPGFAHDQEETLLLTRAAYWLAYYQCNAKFNVPEVIHRFGVTGSYSARLCNRPAGLAKPGPRPMLSTYVIDMIRFKAAIEAELGNGWPKC
jgi:hypothetical protein